MAVLKDPDTIKYMPKITSTKILIAGLFIISLVLAALFFFFRRRPSLPPLPPLSQPIINPFNLDLKNVSTNRIDLSPSLVFPSIPSSLPIYQAQLLDTNLNQIAQVLAQNFNLQSHPTLSNLWISSDNSQTLTLSPRYQSLIYLVNQNLTPQLYQGTPPELNTAIATAKDFITSILNWENLSPQPDSVTYFNTTSFIATPSDADSANLIQIPFIQTLSDYPLYTTNQIQPQFSITLGRGNIIARLELTPQLITQTSPLQSYPLINPTEAKTQILAGKGSLISAISQEPADTPLSQLPSLTLNSVTLEYRFDPYQNLALPYLRFTGQTNPSSQNRTSIILLLPAIQSNYLLAPSP